MGRRIFLLLAITVGVAGVSPVSAGIPDPAFCTVPNVLVNPDGTLEYTVFVANSSGPIDSALVQIVFSAETDGLLCWCIGQTHPLVQAYTNPAGEASFFIAAGGCIDPAAVASPPAVEVLGNGISLAEVGVVGPDAVDAAGLTPTQGWNTGGVCTAGLSDATKHTYPISNGVYAFCTDLDTNGFCELTDAIILTIPLSQGSTCTEGP